MVMKRMAIFGASGGIGVQVAPMFKEYYVIAPRSDEVDVTDDYQVSDFFNANDIDIVVNLSGKMRPGLISDGGDFRDMVDVNIMGNINILSACLPNMIKKGYGRVICASSVFSTMNVPHNSVYCASKAFLDRFIGVANRENVKHGITCNTIQLGYWDGGMAYRIEEPLQTLALNKIGLRRFGSIKELYNTINFIIENEYVCGTNIRIDGGL